MVYSASWKLERYVCSPHFAEREGEGQERPPFLFALQESPTGPAPRSTGSAPALTGQTKLWMLEGGRQKNRDTKPGTGEEVMQPVDPGSVQSWAAEHCRIIGCRQYLNDND